MSTLSQLGAFPMAVVAVLTAQNSQGVTHVHTVPVQQVRQQLDAIFSDFAVAACKVSLVWSSATAEVVAQALRAGNVTRVVVDPVLRASSGHPLVFREEARQYQPLFHVARAVTANLREAHALLGYRIEKAEQASQAARDLEARLGCPVVLKGGHLDDATGTDFLCQSGKVEVIPPGKILQGALRGSGCIFASALTYYLLSEPTLVNAVARAKAFLESTWEAAAEYGSGPYSRMAL